MRHGGNVWQGESPDVWLDYSANLRPEGTPEWVRMAMLEGMENARYYPDPCMKRARMALAEYLGVDADMLLPTAGGISAIRLASGQETSETVLLTPCFCEYEQFARSPVRRVSLLYAGRKISLPRDLKLQKNSIVWLCNPMNPVGYAFERREIEAFLETVEAQNSTLVVDEAFIDYCPNCSAVQLIAAHPGLMITGSMTKILGIPGVRLGYLCAQAQRLRALQGAQTTWELNCFAEAVACALPAHRADITADAQRNDQRRMNFKKALEELGFYVYPSRSACLLADLGRDAQPIADALKARGILVRTCMRFDDVCDGRHIRLAVKDEASNKRFIQTIREVLTCAENH